MTVGPLRDDVVRARVDALLAQMTVEEKAGQLTQYFDFERAPEEAKRVTAEMAAGRAGSLLFVADPVEINRLQRIAVEETRLRIPVLFGYDVIHGLRTVMPVPIAMAASWDPAVVERGQAVAAAEARAIGLHWAFAPMVDIARDPRWGRMIEGAGEDPYLGSVMAAAQVRGFQGDYIGSPGHIIAGPKHFAGYGAALGGRDYDEVDLSDNELWNVYLPPFKAAVDAGAGNIMSAYMGLNGVPATGNRWLLTEVLREAWGFDGFVVTDAGAAVRPQDPWLCRGYRPTPASRALKAGVDMEMAPPFGEAAFQTLPESLAAGGITMDELDAAVRRVLEAKVRMGLFEQPSSISTRPNGCSTIRPIARPRGSRPSARRSCCATSRALLPLDRDIGSIAVIGPFADAARDTVGPWVFQQDDTETVTVLAGIRAQGRRRDRGSSIRPGVSVPARMFKSIFEGPADKPVPRIEVDDDAEIARAVGLAEKADVAILVLGEAQIMIGEHASRSSLDLPGRQQELLDAVIATGTPTVLLLLAARPLDLKGSLPQAQMMIWYPGTQGGAAVANLLFGDVAPGGKLPFNWPRNIGQIPLPYAQLTSHKPGWAAERYWNEPNSPLYPFGFGLSYAPFRYSNLAVSKARIAPGETLEVTVDVT